jgi:hypothetical protein
MDWEFADQLSSNKTPRENARRQMAPKVCVTSPLVLVFKSLIQLLEFLFLKHFFLPKYNKYV